MMKNDVIWIEAKDLKYNPIFNEVPEFSNWEYSCMLTEVAVYGIITPILISKENVVIDGNLRLQASRELKIDKVPVKLFSEQEDFSDLVTKEIKPSELLLLIDLFEKKYNLKNGSKSKTTSIASIVRNNFLGDKKRISKLMSLKKLSNSITSTFPFESKEIWKEMDSFHISLEQGINKMKDLYHRKTTINFSMEYDIAS